MGLRWVRNYTHSLQGQLNHGEVCVFLCPDFDIKVFSVLFDLTSFIISSALLSAVNPLKDLKKLDSF